MKKQMTPTNIMYLLRRGQIISASLPLVVGKETIIKSMQPCGKIISTKVMVI
jgi:hypothetical protein